MERIGEKRQIHARNKAQNRSTIYQQKENKQDAYRTGNEGNEQSVLFHSLYFQGTQFAVVISIVENWLRFCWAAIYLIFYLSIDTAANCLLSILLPV